MNYEKKKKKEDKEEHNVVVVFNIFGLMQHYTGINPWIIINKKEKIKR